MSRSLGRSLELFYIGMVTAEMFNWTGHVLMAPRTQIVQALSRKEAAYGGVYILLGDIEGVPSAYIGESDDISSRIRNHDAKKDWWTSVVMITATDNKLNKAHVRYLEARMIETAKAIGRVPLNNGVTPSLTPLSEADAAKMEAFLDNVWVVLPAVRVDMFIDRARPAPQRRSDQAVASNGSDQSNIERPEVTATFVIENARHDLKATAVESDGEFRVLAGSQARKAWSGVTATYTSLYEELRRSGTLVDSPQGDCCVFAVDYAFSSPSAAAAVVFGRSTNGRDAWRHATTGQKYHDWQASLLTDC